MGYARNKICWSQSEDLNPQGIEIIHTNLPLPNAMPSNQVGSAHKYAVVPMLVIIVQLSMCRQMVIV